MASVNETVTTFIERRGDVYITRADALYYILGTSGTGWEWVDGELVDVDDSPWKRTAPLTVESQTAELRRWHAEQGVPEDMSESLLANRVAAFEQAAKVASEAEKRAQIMAFGPAVQSELYLHHQIREQSNFDSLQTAKFRNVPADAKQDWAEAAQEIRDLLESFGFQV